MQYIIMSPLATSRYMKTTGNEALFTEGDVKAAFTLHAMKGANDEASMAADLGMKMTTELPEERPLIRQVCDATADVKRPFSSVEAAELVVDAALKDFRVVTPVNTPERRPAKKARTSASSACILRSKSDSIDEEFGIKSLYSSNDEDFMNSVHCKVRDEVLEVCRTVSGKIFLRCACCKDIPLNKRAKSSAVSPTRVGTIYRAMVRFMMNHFPACEHIPQRIKEMKAKPPKSGTNEGGIQEYWISSADEKGLVDGLVDGNKCIIYSPFDDMNIVYSPLDDMN
jgi:hypothetical protein